MTVRNWGNDDVTTMTIFRAICQQKHCSVVKRSNTVCSWAKDLALVKSWFSSGIPAVLNQGPAPSIRLCVCVCGALTSTCFERVTPLVEGWIGQTSLHRMSLQKWLAVIHVSVACFSLLFLCFSFFLTPQKKYNFFSLSLSPMLQVTETFGKKEQIQQHTFFRGKHNNTIFTQSSIVILQKVHYHTTESHVLKKLSLTHTHTTTTTTKTIKKTKRLGWWTFNQSTNTFPPLNHPQYPIATHLLRVQHPRTVTHDELFSSLQSFKGQMA